jgi:hypothetical protein
MSRSSPWTFSSVLTKKCSTSSSSRGRANRGRPRGAGDLASRAA